MFCKSLVHLEEEIFSVLRNFMLVYLTELNLKEFTVLTELNCTQHHVISLLLLVLYSFYQRTTKI